MHYLVHVQKERERRGDLKRERRKREKGRRADGREKLKGKGRIEGEEKGEFLATGTQVNSSYRKQASLLFPHCKVFPPSCSLYFIIIINQYLYSKFCSVH